MTLKIFQVDAFTDKPFSGNPAAVCVLSSKKNDSWMQKVAHEMNLSETAFLMPKLDGYVNKVVYSNY
ncbi:PhzF family phenazine biosynthesis protein [Desulfitispora alkaliphila]|uniref:PhzF family phenazine biosynthesis protein n=1 Tax=Desulfitispora alkaliphila TaxID=622674 RepID=UPI003D22E138